MDYIRASVRRSGQSSAGQAQDLEQQRQPEMGEQRPQRTRGFSLSRRNTGGQGQRVDGDTTDVDSPKTPRFHLGLPNMPSARIHLPNLTRTWTRGDSGPASPVRVITPPEPSPRYSQIEPRILPIPVISEPEPSHGSDNYGGNDTGRQRYRGADPGEEHLAAGIDRRRPRHHRSQSQRSTETPKRFLYCFPWVKSRRIRAHILRCFASGLFLIFMLAVCKSSCSTPTASAHLLRT